MSHGYIYIMTNPALKGMVKIGYAANVEERRKQLSTTALPYPYEVYATYETAGNLEDKKIHALIDTLNPDIRITKNREFFAMSPEDAYKLLEAIAEISGTQNRLHRRKIKKTNIKRPPVNFAKCKIPVGATLVFTENPAITVKVADDRKVEYTTGGEPILTSMSSVAEELLHKKSLQGSLYFTYNGKLIRDIAEETQWKNDGESE